MDIKESINQFGEKVTKWENHKHPHNENFMQKVLWIVWEKKDGSIICGYKLDYNDKCIFIYGMTKDEILEKYY